MQDTRSHTSTNQQRKKFLSVAEIPLEYGGSVSGWRKRIFQRQIRYVKAGRSVFIAREDLDRWFAERAVEPESVKGGSDG